MKDTIELLKESDLLITDYSSVFYDFANSRRKINFFPVAPLTKIK